MPKLFLFLCLMFTSVFCINAQNDKPEYVYSAIPPPEFRVEGTDMTGIASGHSILPSGQKIYWEFIYSSTTHKVHNIRFSLPEGMTRETLENSVQAMTILEFWNGVIQCTYQQPNQVVPCAQSLMQQAVRDCRNLANDPNVHCWMNP